MKLSHTPTIAMQAAAKKGISLIDGKTIKEGDVDDLTLAAGKKLASGKKLSDDHVRAMEEFHHAHAGSCPASGQDKNAAEDLMWGGPAGAMWAGTRVAAMDATVLADETVDLDKLFESGTALSFEIFGNTSGEKIELDEGDGLLWAPILRSGTLAVRPGPGGHKVAEPLVFIPGHSVDARKEIGLEDLLDAFNAGAVQHVTIPTSHNNGVLENTGFIKAMKIADSTMRPGEKVLMGGHDFTEPDVKEKVGRGTIANRSCGILYDYTNNETGTTFGAVVEHVCLTNRPFVPGMEPYGALQDLDFSDRTVVPLMLVESSPEKTPPASGSWDGSASRFTDQQYQSSCLIDRKNGKPAKERCSLPVREPSGALNEKGVEAAAAMIGKVSGISTEQKHSAAKKLVGYYKQLKKTPSPALSKMASVSTNMSQDELRAELMLADVAWGDGISLNDIRGQIVELLREMRTSPSDEYGGPHFYVEDVQASPYKARVSCDYGDYLSEENEDNWVIPFTVDDAGKVALADFASWEPVKREWVVDKETQTQKTEHEALLNANPPAVPPTPATTLADLPADPLERAAQERLALSREYITPTIGGRVMPGFTRDQINSMELSNETRAIFLRDLDERERDSAELTRLRKSGKEGEIKTYLTALSDKGFQDSPGFLREVERALLADDGKPAARLDLTDVGGTAEQTVTITDVVKRILDALPLSEKTKKVPAELKPSLLESPIDTRPPVERENLNEEKKPLTGLQLAAQWEKDLDGKLDLPLGDLPGAVPAAGAAAGKE